jgi:uncharacterized protein
MTPQIHLFTSDVGSHLLVVDGSRVYDLDEPTAATLAEANEAGAAAVEDLLEQLELTTSRRYIDETPLDPPPVRAVSLAVAQACNLGCGYCYAQQGSFGGPARRMEWPVAQATIDRLLADSRPQDSVNVAFLGGEPLMNRALIRKATEYAAQRGRALGVDVRFSITSNGTLVEPEDGDFFEDYGFAVTISVDGIGQDHDRLRPFRGGGGSYERILARVTPLLHRQRRMQVGARVTVTPLNLGLRHTLDGLVALGFHSVGFSPMLTAPSGRHELQAGDLDAMLAEMVACGREFERRVADGQRYPFSNMEAAMQQIHRGTHRPYPCGAGAAYLGVSATGGLFACHRFVENDRGAMGNVFDGADDGRRRVWLLERHVHRQEPCKTCWARYICGGGCHHEVLLRGRPACDYIRAWLHYCLQAYAGLLARRPDYFGEATMTAIGP